MLPRTSQSPGDGLPPPRVWTGRLLEKRPWGSRLSPFRVSWQVYHAQQAGFLGVIVHNVGSDDLLNMVWEDGEWRRVALLWALGSPRLLPPLTAPLPSPDQLRRHITVPSVFTGETAATYLRSLFTYERG